MINTKETAWNNENVQFISLLLISVFVVYFTPLLLSQIFFILVLFFILISKKDYFWIAFLFILLEGPGRLFSGSSGIEITSGYASYLKSLPFYQLTPGIRLSFQDLFFLVLIYKTFTSRRSNNFIFKNDATFLILYFIAVMIYSFTYPMTLTNFLYTFRKAAPWVLLFFIPGKYSLGDFIKFDRLIFPFVFIALLSQVFTYATGQYLINYFSSASTTVRESYLWTEAGGTRAGDSAFILFYCFIKGTFYFFNKRKTFPQKYITLIIFISFLSMFLTATRGWILAASAIVALTLIQNSNKLYFSRTISFAISGIFLIIILVLIIPGFDNQATFVINRVLSVREIAQGDLTAGGTLSRISDRAPAVLREFRNSPFLGYGFSNKFYEKADIHVGHPTMLLNIGITGFIIFTFIFFKWLFYIIKMARKKIIKDTYGNSVMVFSSALIFLYILHSSSQSNWGFYMPYEQSILSICVLLTYFSALVNDIPNLIRRNKVTIQSQ